MTWKNKDIEVCRINIVRVIDAHNHSYLTDQGIDEALKEIDRTYEKLRVNPVRKEGVKGI